jgi:uncharacterized protein YjbI with pentapeptide repeats
LDAKFFRTDASASVFRQAVLSNCDFREAKLKGSDFTQAALALSRFGGASMCFTDLRAADLKGARELSSQQLCEARTGEGTILPSGGCGAYLRGSGAERPMIR